MMRRPATPQPNEIKKLQLEETVLFAINNIPRVDSTTLKQFLDLVNVGGTFGTISHEQILKKMRQVLKYVPGTCTQSMLILMDLLEIEPSEQLALDAPQNGRFQPDSEQTGLIPFVIESPKPVAGSQYR